jgi:hypothetical protein
MPLFPNIWSFLRKIGIYIQSFSLADERVNQARRGLEKQFDFVKGDDTQIFSNDFSLLQYRSTR